MSALRRMGIRALVVVVPAAVLVALLLILTHVFPSPAGPMPAEGIAAAPPSPEEPSRPDPEPTGPPPPASLATPAIGSAPDPSSPPAADPPSVRIVDGRTGEPIDITYEWPAFRLQWPDGRWEPPPKERRGPDARGGFPVDFPLPADRDPAAGDPRFLEVELPGWEIARLPLEAIRGPVDLPLQPLEISVAGRLLFPGEEPSSALIEVFPAAGTGREMLARADGFLGRDGRFEIRGLPPGTWVLRAAVRSRVPGERWDESRVARRVLEKGEGIVDLGLIELVEPVSVRVRVLDERGDPVGGATLHIDAAERPGLQFTVEGTNGWVTEGPVGSMMGCTTPEGDDGWLEIGGLDPGGDYRFLEDEKVIEVPVLVESDGSGEAVTVLEPAAPSVSFEILPVTFTAPARPGESLDVELRRKEVPAEKE